MVCIGSINLGSNFGVQSSPCCGVKVFWTSPPGASAAVLETVILDSTVDVQDAAKQGWRRVGHMVLARTSLSTA